jgi:hypothetical protein
MPAVLDLDRDLVSNALDPDIDGDNVPNELDVFPHDPTRCEIAKKKIERGVIEGKWLLTTRLSGIFIIAIVVCLVVWKYKYLKR